MSIKNRLSKLEKKSENSLARLRLSRMSDDALIEFERLTRLCEARTATQKEIDRAHKLWSKTL